MFWFLVFAGVGLLIYSMKKFSSIQKRLDDLESDQRQGSVLEGYPQSVVSFEKKLSELSDNLNRLIDYLIQRYDIKDIRQKEGGENINIIEKSQTDEQLIVPPLAIQDVTSTAQPVENQVEKEELQKKTFFDSIDWEKFTGIKLFSWIGGLAMFLGIIFFMKYSIDQGLVSPMVRVSVGFLVGVSAIIGGLQLRKNGYPVTVQTLCAAGIAVLYADIFAASALYHFIPAGLAFFLMIQVTVVAFFLAVHLDSVYVALLGLIGGFLIPPLLSTGIDRPFALFTYIALLDIGTASVALRKKWNFLISMAAGASVIMQIGWAVKFFMVSKALTASVIFLVFPVLFFIIHLTAERQNRHDERTFFPAFVLPLISMLFAGYMTGLRDMASQPALVLTFLFLLSVLPAVGAMKYDKARIFILSQALFRF